MRKAIVAVLISGALVVSAETARADGDTPPFAAMAPIERYLTADRNQEIVLARSAAPASISGDAAILVLTRKGYEVAAEGKNGFTCLVERGWMAPLDGPDFMDPNLRGPVCYNAVAVRTHLPYVFNRTRLALAGRDREQMRGEIAHQVATKELPVPEPGGMSYMTSKEQALGRNGHWHPHVMVHLPRTDAAVWGANFPGSRVFADPTQEKDPEPETTFFVVVDSWSDGTRPDHDH